MGKQRLVAAAMALGILAACGTYSGDDRNQRAGGETAAAVKVTEQVQAGYAAYFAFDSAKLDSEADAAVAAAIEAAKESGTGEILLSGHTDQAGAADYNMKLARRRVDAVAARLQAAGYHASRTYSMSCSPHLRHVCRCHFGCFQPLVALGRCTKLICTLMNLS